MAGKIIYKYKKNGKMSDVHETKDQTYIYIGQDMTCN